MNWILLRGWSREARHWGDFPAQLQAALGAGSAVASPVASHLASPVTVRALDLPGNGSRHLERSPARVSAMVDAVRENLSGPGKFHLLGLSLGAMACVDWAARFPGELAACVLLSASLRPFSPFYERLRPGNLPKVAGLFLEKDAARREAGILALTSSGAGAGLAPVWARYAEDRPVSRGNVLRQLVAAARFSAPLNPPPVPLLVLAGMRDRLVDPHCSETLARRWNAPLVLHPTAGHDLPLDDGAWVTAQIKRWLPSLP
jgi:pimeloyl-ACP methyl ester carboxylesterase